MAGAVGHLFDGLSRADLWRHADALVAELKMLDTAARPLGDPELSLVLKEMVRAAGRSGASHGLTGDSPFEEDAVRRMREELRAALTRPVTKELRHELLPVVTAEVAALERRCDGLRAEAARAEAWLNQPTPERRRWWQGGR